MVMPAISELLNENRSRLAALVETSGDFESLVVPLEDMEHTLSRVWSPVSHLQGVLGAGDWRAAYEEALPLLTEYSTEISQNQALQKAYSRVREGLDKDATDAQRSTLDQALRDFHLAGVDLDDDSKARFKAIMQELAATQSAFANNVQDATDAWSLDIADKAELAGLPGHVIERAATDDGYRLTLDFPTYYAVTTHAESRSLRETLMERTTLNTREAFNEYCRSDGSD